VSSDRKSTVLEDSRLLDKLNAIEKEKSVSVSGRNAVATTTTITTMTTVEQHVEVNKAIVSVDNHNHNNNNNNNVEEHDSIERMLTADAIHKNNQTVVDEHDSIKEMLKTMSDQSVNKSATSPKQQQQQQQQQEVRQQQVESAFEFSEEMFARLEDADDENIGEEMKQQKSISVLNEDITAISTSQHPSENTSDAFIIRQQPANKAVVSIKLGGSNTVAKPVKISVKMNDDDSISSVVVDCVHEDESASQEEIEASSVHSESLDSMSDDMPVQPTEEESVRQEEEIEASVMPVQSKPSDSLSRSVDIQDEHMREESSRQDDEKSIKKFASETSDSVISDAMENIGEITKTISLKRKLSSPATVTAVGMVDVDEEIVPKQQRVAECEVNFEAMMQEEENDEDSRSEQQQDQKRKLAEDLEEFVPIQQGDVECEVNFEVMMRAEDSQPEKLSSCSATATVVSDNDESIESIVHVVVPGVSNESTLQEEGEGDSQPEEKDQNLQERRTACKEKLEREIELTKGLEIIHTKAEEDVAIVKQNDYESACAEINPRVGNEINDREQRIQRLLQLGQSATQEDEIEENNITVTKQNQVEAVPCDQPTPPEGACAEDSDRRNVLIKALLTKMSSQHKGLTLVKKGKMVQITYSIDITDEEMESKEIVESSPSHRQSSSHDHIDGKNDPSDEKQDEEEQEEDDTKVEKIALAIMTKYRALDDEEGEDQDRRKHIVCSQTSEDLFEAHSIVEEESGAGISSLDEEDSVEATTVKSGSYIIHDSLVDGVKVKKEISKEEMKLTKNHFFDGKNDSEDEGDTMMNINLGFGLPQMESSKTSKPSVNLVKTSENHHLNQTQSGEVAVSSSQKATDSCDGGEEQQQSDVDRKVAEELCQEPQLSTGENKKLKELEQNIQPSPATAGVQTSGAYNVAIDESTEENVVIEDLKESNESSAVTTGVQTSETYKVGTYESTTTTTTTEETTVQHTNALNTVKVQAIKRNTNKSINISSHSYVQKTPIESSYDFHKTVEMEESTLVETTDTKEELAATTKDQVVTELTANAVVMEAPIVAMQQKHEESTSINFPEISEDLEVNANDANTNESIKDIVMETSIVATQQKDEESAPIDLDEILADLVEDDSQVDQNEETVVAMEPSIAMQLKDKDPDESTRNNFAEILEDSQQKLLKQLDESEAHAGEITTDYDSECHKINPRLEREVSDRERRIQALLNRTHEGSSSDDDVIEMIASDDVYSEVSKTNMHICIYFDEMRFL